MKHQELIPQLRFKEFDGEWEEKRLKQLIKDLRSGKSVNSEDRPIRNDLEFGILKTSSVVNGNFIETENKKIVDDEITLAKLNPTKDEIIISRMNTPQLVGESGYIDKTYRNLFVPDRLWQTVIYKEECHNRWLSQFLITDRVRYNLKSIATGTSGTMKNISKPNFLSIKVTTPKLPEQQKIASFLTAVDTKIQQLNTKKELLVQYKNGVIQQLFSQQLRCKRDDGGDFEDWEEKRLGEVFKIFNGYAFSSKDSQSKGVLWVKIADVGIQEMKKNNISFLPNYFSEKHKKFLLKKGDFILALTRPILNGKLKIAKVNEFYNNSLLNQRVGKILTKNHKDFVFYLLQKDSLIKSIENNIAGTDPPNLSPSEINNLKVMIPSLPEQQKIASYLSALDAKISVVQSQVEETQLFKKGLLQQLFV